MSDKLSVQDIKHIFTNPFYCIDINDSLTLPHVPMVSRDEWIYVNSKLINELGAKEWLTLLLDNLEGNFV